MPFYHVNLLIPRKIVKIADLSDCETVSEVSYRISAHFVATLDAHNADACSELSDCDDCNESSDSLAEFY